MFLYGSVANLTEQELLEVVPVGSLAVESEGVLTLELCVGVVAPQVPVTTFYSALFLFLAATHTGFDTVVDTGRVSDDQRRTVVSLSLADSLEGLSLVGAHSNLCYIYIAVGRSDQTEVFLADTFAGRSEFGDSAERSSFRRLATGVRVYLGVEYEDIHILAACEYVVETAEADIVCSTVTGNDPLRTCGDKALKVEKSFAGVAVACLAEGHELVGNLAGYGRIHCIVEPLLGKSLHIGVAAVAYSHLLHDYAYTLAHLVGGDLHTETKLCEVFEE